MDASREPADRSERVVGAPLEAACFSGRPAGDGDGLASNRQNLATENNLPIGALLILRRRRRDRPQAKQLGSGESPEVKRCGLAETARER